MRSVARLCNRFANTHHRAMFRIDAADRRVRVPVLGPGVVQPEAEIALRVGGDDVGDRRRVDLAQFREQRILGGIGHGERSSFWFQVIPSPASSTGLARL